VSLEGGGGEGERWELTDLVVFSEPDQAEADGGHACVAEEGDRVVGALELRSGVAGQAGGHACCEGDGAEWVAAVYRHCG